MSRYQSSYNLSGQILIAGCFLLAVVAIFATPDCLRAEAEPPFRSLRIGSDEIFVQRPLKGGFVLPDCGTRLVLPEAWHDNVVLVDMPGTGDAAAKAVYGLLFYPPDIVVQAQQYLGAVLVYDRAFMDDIGDETAVKLGATATVCSFFITAFSIRIAVCPNPRGLRR